MTVLTIGHMRKLVNLAYNHVEALREQKARLELVEYVPSKRPVDLVNMDQCTAALKALAAAKCDIEYWHDAEHIKANVGLHGIVDLSKDMQLFDVLLLVDNVQETIEISTRTKPGEAQ